MEKFETFAAYIHSDLTPEEEQQFFSSLSYDTDLRNDFRRFITLENSIKKSAGSFVPPNSVTNAIYSELGFTTPGSLALAAKPAAMTPIFSSKLFIAALSSVLSIAATLLLINMLGDGGSNLSDKGLPRDYRSTENTFPYKDYLLAENNTVQSESPKIEEARQVQVQHADNPARTRYLPTKHNVAADKFQPKEAVLVDSSEIPVREANPNNLLRSSISDDIQSNYTQVNIPDNTEDKNNYGITVALINSLSWDPAEKNISTANLSKFNNLGIAVTYNLGTRFFAGIELRQETFYLKYNGVDRSTKFLYEQEPNLTNIGVVAGYKIVKLGDNNIDIQTAFGGNYYGYVGRLALNYNYSYDNRIIFFAGTELNEFLYKYQYGSFQSQKFNLNFGMKYNF